MQAHSIKKEASKKNKEIQLLLGRIKTHKEKKKLEQLQQSLASTPQAPPITTPSLPSQETESPKIANEHIARQLSSIKNHLSIIHHTEDVRDNLALIKKQIVRQIQAHKQDEATISDQRNQISKNIQEITRLTQDSLTLRKEAKELRSGVDRSEAKAQQLTIDNQQYIQSIQRYEEMKTLMERDIAALSATIQELKAQNFRLAQQNLVISTAQSNSANTESEYNSKLERTIESMKALSEERFNSFQLLVREKEDTISRLNIRIAELEKQFQQAALHNMEIVRLNQMLSEERHLRTNAQLISEALTKEGNILKDKLENANKTNVILKGQASELEIQVQSKDEEVQLLASEILEMENRCSEYTNIVARCAGMQSALKATEQKLLITQKQAYSYQEEVRRIKTQELDKARTQNLQIANQLKAAVEKYQASEESVRQLRDRLNQQLFQNNQLVQEIGKLKEKVFFEREKYQSERNVTHELRMILDNYNQQIETIRKQENGRQALVSNSVPKEIVRSLLSGMASAVHQYTQNDFRRISQSLNILNGRLSQSSYLVLQVDKSRKAMGLLLADIQAKKQRIRELQDLEMQKEEVIVEKMLLLQKYDSIEDKYQTQKELTRELDRLVKQRFQDQAAALAKVQELEQVVLNLKAELVGVSQEKEKLAQQVQQLTKRHSEERQGLAHKTSVLQSQVQQITRARVALQQKLRLAEEKIVEEQIMAKTLKIAKTQSKNQVVQQSALGIQQSKVIAKPLKNIGQEAEGLVQIERFSQSFISNKGPENTTSVFIHEKHTSLLNTAKYQEMAALMQTLQQQKATLEKQNVELEELLGSLETATLARKNEIEMLKLAHQQELKVLKESSRQLQNSIQVNSQKYASIIQTLNEEIRELTEQNHRLMDELHNSSIMSR